MSIPIDPNPSYLLTLANYFQKIWNIELDIPSLSVDQYTSIIKFVGNVLLGEKAMRINEFIEKRPKEELEKKIKKLSAKVIEVNREFKSLEDAVVKSLFLYYGYLNMAKICRRETHGLPIPLNHRFEVYSQLTENAKMNHWIRAGIIVVRIRNCLNQETVTCWIPKNSTYYEEL